MSWSRSPPRHPRSCTRCSTPKGRRHFYPRLRRQMLDDVAGVHAFRAREGVGTIAISEIISDAMPLSPRVEQTIRLPAGRAQIADYARRRQLMSGYRSARSPAQFARDQLTMTVRSGNDNAGRDSLNRRRPLRRGPAESRHSRYGPEERSARTHFTVVNAPTLESPTQTVDLRAVAEPHERRSPSGGASAPATSPRLPSRVCVRCSDEVQVVSVINRAAAAQPQSPLLRRRNHAG